MTTCGETPNSQERHRHEEALVTAFVVAAKRDRWLAFLSNAKHRARFLDVLNHPRDFDERFVRTVPPDHRKGDSLAAILRSMGAPNRSWLISVNRALDGRSMPLEDAMMAVVGWGQGSVVLCVPGVLAFVETEEAGERFILHRPGVRPSRNS